MTPDGWLRTGDLGRVDDDGRIFLVDRVKDLVISGGENVYPVEVENVLAAHPQLAEVAVIGVPHERWVFIWAGAHAYDEWFVSERAELAASPLARERSIAPAVA